MFQGGFRWLKQEENGKGFFDKSYNGITWWVVISEAIGIGIQILIIFTNYKTVIRF